MSKNEDLFDISMILMTLFSLLETIRDENNIELVYDIDPTVPKELKGDSKALLSLLTQILTFVFQNTERDEIVLSITAPEDFFYEEIVTFSVRDTGINNEKMQSFVQNRLENSLKPLHAVVQKSNENPTDIIVSLPLKVDDIGNRRHYRLPDISMLGKKVLLICEKQNVAKSIKKMFRYFLYEVDMGLEEYKKKGSNLSYYDMVVISDSMTTPKLEALILHIQLKNPLKYVVVKSSNSTDVIHREVDTAYLIKPVMQESIYELIVSLYKEEIRDRTIKPENITTIIDMGKYINHPLKLKGQEYVESTMAVRKQEENKNKKVFEADTEPVLDTELGLKNTQRIGMDYGGKLRAFLEAYEHSDIQFRQLVKDKSVWAIKEFLTKIEKEARLIGALRLASLLNKANLLFVYENQDELPLYVSRYHLALKRLKQEIEKFLNA